MKKWFVIVLLGFGVFFHLQAQNAGKKDSLDTHWLKILNEKGLDEQNDSLKISEEFVRILNDSSYQALLYPETYTWPVVVQLLGDKQLKPAFWYLINLYPKDEKSKEMAVRSILTYEKLFKMDEVLINTFYTYAFLDPEISQFKDSVPEMTRPDILEKKLHHVKEIIKYIYSYREQSK
jgi:hypothetical protein